MKPPSDRSAAAETPSPIPALAPVLKVWLTGVAGDVFDTDGDVVAADADADAREVVELIKVVEDDEDADELA